MRQRIRVAEAAASRRKAAATDAKRRAPSPGRQRLWRDIALILVAPLLLYLLASLFTYSPQDPGWSHSGSITAPLHNVGGAVGAWLADFLLHLTGYVAFLLPVMLGMVAWIALFGMDADNEAELGPALRLVGLVGFMITGKIAPEPKKDEGVFDVSDHREGRAGRRIHCGR